MTKRRIVNICTLKIFHEKTRHFRAGFFCLNGFSPFLSISHFSVKRFVVCNPVVHIDGRKSIPGIAYDHALDPRVDNHALTHGA